MEFNTILYNLSESTPYLFAVVPGFIDLLILFKKDVTLKHKLIFVILVILLFVFIYIYTNNLVEMPKIVDEVYADAIITLNENELTHTLINKEDVNNTNNWRVVYQSVSEGVIINKNIVVSLVLDEIVEEDLTNKDNSEITSNGDNSITIQNNGGTVKIDNSTTIIQSQVSTIANTQFEDTTEIHITEDTTASTKSETETTTTNISTLEVSTVFNNEWNETEFIETFYIKTDCYSRTKAIVGSDSVEKYYVGTMVNVIAVTDTGYYKLVDGTFIHSDYITDEPPYMDIYEEDYNEYSDINSNIEILVESPDLTILVGESVNVKVEMRGTHSATLCNSDDLVVDAHWTDRKVDSDIAYLTITGINAGSAYIKVYFNEYPDVYALINVYVIEDNDYIDYIEQTSTNLENDLDTFWIDVFG